MYNTIIGTAGHVDHGKTTLIKALTGIETDRLKEEKRRGITIELGFAYLILPNGEKVGIIDVPGHEKFVKNMLAGAGSMDLAILVVAADEGFMPQTREHLAILSMMGIKSGVIALTKADLVEKDWLDMVLLDIEDEVAGSFLEGAAVIPVSSHSGMGLDALKAHIFAILEQSSPKADYAPARLPVDRVFSMDGFGTVVTGTLIEGMLNTGDEVMLYPSKKAGKIRRMHVHGDIVEQAQAGNRVAVNISGLRVADIEKGDVLAQPGSIENADIIHVRIDVLPDSAREILNNSRLHFHHGTRELLCRVNILGRPAIAPGESAYAQLILSEPLAAKPMDAFVLRFYSPLETIGGGIILDPHGQKIGRKDVAAADNLKTLAQGSFGERIAAFILRHSKDMPRAAWLRKVLFNCHPDFDDALAQLVGGKTIYHLNDSQSLVHNGYLAILGKQAQNILSRHHATNPFQKGMAQTELRSRLLPKIEQPTADDLLDLLIKLKHIVSTANLLAHPDFSIKISDGHKMIFDEIARVYQAAGLMPPATDDVAAKYKDKKIFAQIMAMLVNEGELIMLDSQIYMHHSYVECAKKTFADMAKVQPEISLAQFRDKTGISRKYALAILEYFDKKGITKKIGDARVLAP